MIGRPSSFTQEIADEICTRLANGESLRSITKNTEVMPAQGTVFRWLADNESFREQYTRAREAQAEYMADEIIDIADNSSNDWMESNDPGNPGYKANGEAINRARLRVDARKWVASKLLPKKYGDKVQVGGADDLPPVKTETAVTVALDFTAIREQREK